MLYCTDICSDIFVCFGFGSILVLSSVYIERRWIAVLSIVIIQGSGQSSCRGSTRHNFGHPFIDLTS